MEKVFTETGLWLTEFDPGKVRIGLSAKGQDDLGEVSFFDPFSIDEVTAGEAFCAIEAAKAVTEIEAPVSGVVLQFNEKLLTMPENLNELDEKLNWLLEVSVNDFDQTAFLAEDLPIEE